MSEITLLQKKLKDVTQHRDALLTASKAMIAHYGHISPFMVTSAAI